MDKPVKYRKWDVSEKEFLTQANPMKILIFVSQLHHRMLEKLVGATGLHRAQHRMLMTLADHEFESQSALANMLEISTATVAVSLKKLERDGYIQKKVKEGESRATVIQLTERGKKVVESSREIFESMDKKAVRGFTDEELVLLRTFLGRMYENLSERK